MIRIVVELLHNGQVRAVCKKNGVLMHIQALLGSLVGIGPLVGSCNRGPDRVAITLIKRAFEDNNNACVLTCLSCAMLYYMYR